MAHVNMMQNGMPGQGQVHGMQRPQPGNINDQVAAQILQGLQTELPKFQHSWQATVPLGARVARVMQLITQLKFIEPDLQKCLRTALQYEHTTISQAPDIQNYNQQIMRKLADISAKRNQNLGPMGFNGNGGQMTPNQAMNAPGAQMNPRAQQLQNMNMQAQHMPNNGMNQLGAPSMQPSMSQNAHQQQPQQQQQQQHMNGTPNQQPPQMQQPTPQEIQETAQRMLASLTEEKKAQLRNGVMRSMNEQQRQQASATKKDPLIQFIYQKARQDVMNRRASGQMANGQQPQQQQQQQQNMQMTNAGGANMTQSASQQGNNFDFTAIMGQQANALKLQESGNEVVPASNNPNNMFNGQMHAQNGQPGGINPAMLANGNGQGGAQMPPNMSREQMQMLVMQREKQRQEQMRNNANNVARAQALSQAQLHGQNMGAQNALNGAAGGSPAMTMLNRPIQPPGSQTPNTPQQPNRAPNMQQQQQQQQQQGQATGNGANALLQHHQSMVNRNNTGVNMQALLASLPPHPVFQVPQAQNIIRTMPPPVIEKLRATAQTDVPNFIKQWAATQQRRSQASMQMGGPQGVNQPGMNAMPNGMPDMNMQQAMLSQGQPQVPQGMDPAQLQARMQQQQLQQQQQAAQHQQQQQQQQAQQQQQQHQQQPQRTPSQQTPGTAMDHLPPALKHQAMLSRPFPQAALQQLGIAVPPNVRSWGQLKMHIDAHAGGLQPGTLQRFNQMIGKWFNDHPEEFQAGVKWVIMQRQNQQAQQQQAHAQAQAQAQVQNAGHMVNNGNAGMQNSGHIGAPTAQMMQPTPQMQQGVNVPQMGPGQGPLRMPPDTPVGAGDIAMFRQRINGSHAMTDDQIRNIIITTRRKTFVDQNNALKQAQMHNQLSQNTAGGNQQARPNRTPGQVGNEQAPVVQQQAGQKRAQPTASANDDVMEIPNPNAQQQTQANKPRPSGSIGDMKLPNLTNEQLDRLNPTQREQLKKRYDSLRQANAGAHPMQGGVSATPQAPMVPQQNDQKSQTASDIDATFKRLYQEVNHPKGPQVQQDPQAVEQITGILRKIYKTYSQIDKIFSTALRLPEFTEERIKQLMRAKITVYHNWDASTDSVKGYLSINLNSAMYAQRLVGEFLRDMNQAKARGQLNQQLAQQAQQQGQAQQQQQQQQQQQATAKVPAGQAPAMEKTGSKHGRKASSSSRPPPAPTDNKSFDWGVGVSSPHGIPKYDNAVTLTPENLKIPPNKRRRTGQPESADATPAGQTGTPSGASPGIGGVKSNSPEQLRKAQIQARAEAEERDKKRWKCTKDAACEASITGFETEDELKRHFDSIHAEIENPLQFLLDSAAETLGVDLDGNPLPGKIADKGKPGAKLMPPKAGAMKRESSLTPAIKQEVRTPAGQATAFATPGSGNKATVKPAGKEGAATVNSDGTTALHHTIANKIGYQPLVVADSEASAPQSLTEDQLWAEISSTVAAGVSSFEPFNFDGSTGALVTDWGLRPDDAAGVPSSPETTPKSSSASLNSDVSGSDNLRINFEWDAFGNGDVAVPEMLNAAVSGLGLGNGEAKSNEQGATGQDQQAAASKKDSEKTVDPFEWNADNDVSWDNIFASQDNDGVQFDMSFGGQGDTEMQFVF